MHFKCCNFNQFSLIQPFACHTVDTGFRGDGVGDKGGGGSGGGAAASAAEFGRPVRGFTLLPKRAVSGIKY